MKKLSIFLMIILLCGNSFAISKVGTTAAQFLKIGVGSRAIGMGGAFVAVSNDITALFWNPGGLPRLPRNEAILVHTEWLADISFDYAAVAVNLGGMGSIGFSLTAVNMGEMKVRTELEPEGTGEYFDAADLAGTLTYARSLTDRFSMGINFKYIRQSIWHMSSQAVAIDIGTLFTTQFNDMKIGMSISNFGPNMRMSGRDAREYIDINPEAKGSNDQIPAYRQLEAWSLPILFRVGVAMDAINRPNNRLTVALDALHPNDNSESVNLGLEYAFYNMAFVRMGWEALFLPDNERSGLFDDKPDDEYFPSNLGVGFNLAINPALKIKMDYAYADFGRLHNAQRFSIGIEF
jgi:hypothetical protein